MSDKKVWIVTSGCYSDYDIMACFSTEELANDFCSKFEQDDDWGHRVEEHNLDEVGNIKNLTPYFVRMTKDGVCHNIRVEDSSYGFTSKPKPGYCIHGNMHIHVWAKDEAHAIKICNEHRLIEIAENRWNKRR